MTSFLWPKGGQTRSYGNFSLRYLTGRPSLITAEGYLEEGIFRTNEDKLVFMTGDMTGGIYQGVVYNPDTKQSQVFDIFNGERDFPVLSYFG